MKGRVFRIQRFSIHDGYGIRTTVFFKGCPLRCVWCHNPESQKFDIEIGYRAEKCLGCYTCLNACSKRAIGRGSEAPVELDRNKCNGCGECVKVCRGEALEIYGMDVSVEDVMKVIEKDIVFYKNSGGGATFSGGEPYFQPEFLLSLLKSCKERGISTAVDTSGYAEWKVIESTLPFIDFFLYDVKDYRSDRHRIMCGAGNELILSNLHNLIDFGAEVIVRIPVIPGYNFEEGDFDGYTKLLTKAGVERVDLLPYHSLARDKYRWLGRDYKLPEMSEKARDLSAKFAEFLKNAGFEVTVGGYF